VKGACVLNSSQSVNDPARIIAPPPNGYVCSESGLTTN
jgi:hypothetical protein